MPGKLLNCKMPTIKIQTSQNIELEYELAGIGDRLVAYIIDLLIYAAYIITVFLIADVAGGKSGSNWTPLFLILPIFFYQLLCEVFLNGQSLGKKAKQIKVISLSGNQPNIGQYLIRWIFRIVDDMIGSGVIAILTIALSDKAQRVGDILAGTTVVRTNPNTSFQETLFSETEADYIPQFKLVHLLNDSDITLLKEVINRYVKDPYNNNAILQKAYDKTRNILGVTENYEAISFLETVIKDYNHATGKG
jgi:uncharacterized RDD family membrane protein YckC